MRGGVTFFPYTRTLGTALGTDLSFFLYHPLAVNAPAPTECRRLISRNPLPPLYHPLLFPDFRHPSPHPTHETAHDEPLAPRLTWIPHLRISGDRRGELGRNGLGKPVVDWSGRVRGHVCAHRPSLATQALNEPREPIVDPDEAHPGIPLSQISPTLPYGRGGDSFG
jgi:hypothetical protein